MITIRDVASAAGVTISTVSKVINNYPNISDETKNKVVKAINELNYVPNQIASSLRGKTRNRVALLIKIDNFSNDIGMNYIKYIVKYASNYNYDMFTIFYNMIEDLSKEEVIKYFMQQGIRAVIIFGMNKEDNLLLKIVDSKIFKIVLIDTPIYNENTSSIWIDEENAQYDVIAKTIENNTSKIKNFLYITGSSSSYVMEGRIKGAKRYAKEHNIDITIKNGHFLEKKAFDLTMKYGKDYNMIACASDLMAIGSMNALITLDIFRPVCGFDGIILMGYAGKKMNTVKQNFKEISKLALIEVNSLLKGNPGKVILSDYELVRLKYEDILK